MIDYKHFIYAAPPRCGNAWFLNACAIAGLGEHATASAHPPFQPGQRALTVTSVRHPYDLLASYYLEIKGGHTGVAVMDKMAPLAKHCVDFHTFCEGYLRQFPGQISRLFDCYPASSVLRLEDQPYAALGLFETIGISADRLERIKALPPMNLRKNQAWVEFSKLRRQVVEAERAFCEHYEYS